MTSRGNPSISPPAQISQQRHVNAISSSTPPPQQQYYTGPSPALQQGGYDYIPQQQPQGQAFLSYQAYGSAVNEARGQPGNSGRGGPPQQNLPQGGGYYQQPGQNMRPQQSQQGPTAHQQYFLSSPAPTGVRQRTPHPPSSSQPMVVYPQGFPGGNNVIIPNMYQGRVPLYQPYAPGPVSYPSSVMYFTNGTQWRGGMAPAPAPPVRPQAREKRVLDILDPDTGRNITEEIFSSIRPQSTEAEEHHEDTPQVNQNEIAKTFTRMVADRLKTDDSNVPGSQGDSQGAVGDGSVGPGGAAQASQYQQPPPQQQPPPLGPSSLMRPHMSGPPSIPPPHMMPPRPNMMQQPPASATPIHDMQHQHQRINVSLPPPQFPVRQQPGPVMYNPNQQQQQMPPVHHSRHPQQQQQPPQQQQQAGVRPQMPPVVLPASQQIPPVQAPHHGSAAENIPPPVKMEASAPEKPKPPMETPHMTPKENIPMKTPVAPAVVAPPPPVVTKPQSPPAKQESPVKKDSPVKQVPDTKQAEPTGDIKPSPVAAPPKDTVSKSDMVSSETTKPSTRQDEVKTPEDASTLGTQADSQDTASGSLPPATEKTDENVKDESGAGSQGVKDGRKGKKNKKDFNRKEISGTDMDAFIDPEVTTDRKDKSRKKSTKKLIECPFMYPSYADVCSQQTHPPQVAVSSEKEKIDSESISERTVLPYQWKKVTTKVTNPWGKSDPSKDVVKRDPLNPWKANSDKKVTSNPWILKRPEAAQTDSSQDKVHKSPTNPWAVRVNTVKSSDSNLTSPWNLGGVKGNDHSKNERRDHKLINPWNCKVVKGFSHSENDGRHNSTNPWILKAVKEKGCSENNGGDSKMSCVDILKCNGHFSLEAFSTASSESEKKCVNSEKTNSCCADTGVDGTGIVSQDSGVDDDSTPGKCEFDSEGEDVLAENADDLSHTSETTVNTDESKSKENQTENTLISSLGSLAAMKIQNEFQQVVLTSQSSDKVDGVDSGAGEAFRTRTNNAIEVPSETTVVGAKVSESSADYPAMGRSEPDRGSFSSDGTALGDVEKETPQNEGCSESLNPTSTQPENSMDKDMKDISVVSVENQKQVAAPVQVESKHKLKKKKKKKGRKTPPMQKAKQSASANDSVEASENDIVETEGKPPLPPPTAERRNSQDKSGQDLKSLTTAVPATQDVVSNVIEESSPQPETAPPSSKIHTPEVPVTSPAVQGEPSKTVDDVPSTTPSNVSNQNQPKEILTTSITSSNHLPGQAETFREQPPLDNGVSLDVHSEKMPSAPSDTSSVSNSQKMNHQAFNDENEPPKDSSSEQKEDSKMTSQSADSDGAPVKPPSEKAGTKLKKEGKDKLQYDRAYLMELRECASSQTKPEGLPNLEIILDRPVTPNRGTNVAPLDFTPAFFQHQRQHAPPIGKSNSRNRRPEVQMGQRVIKSVSITNDVKPLHQSEKPWKPSPKQLSGGEMTDKKKSLESEVFFIMNRLTPTNFERLAEEMKKLNIKVYDDLQELVRIFFDKVTMETKFVEAYAKLCKVMSGLKVPPPAGSGMKENQATFRVVMLTKCQQEFEADKSTIFEDPEEKRKKLESEMSEGPERTEHIEKTLYQMKLRRLKFYGNIRFIGELFKLGMLTENIMHDCIYRLLKARDDDSLVSLCNLVTTVGQNLDTEKARGRMDQYFAQMAKIAEERKSRIKFTLKDAIDLRNNNWIPRKEQTGPKKIDEVHKDFQQEQATKQYLQSQPLPPRQETPQSGSRRGSRQRQDDNKPSDDGWNTVATKSLRIDASKMKLSKQTVVDENSIQLGPGGGMNKFSMWSRGSFGGGPPAQESERPAPAANRFSALRGEEDRGKNFQRSPSRGDSGVANRGMRQGPTAGHGRGKIMARSSQEGERREALASARSIVGGRSQNSSRDNSWNREDRRQAMGPRGSREGENQMTRSDISLRPNTESSLPPSTALASSVGRGPGADDVKKLKPMSEEEMEQKAKNILEEYLNVMDLKEAKLCIRELEGQAYLHALVTACINDVLERSNKDRELTGQFFHEMVKDNLISLDMYIKGLSEVLQFAEDMVIDIPMLWTYLAQMVVPLLIGGTLPWSKLSSALKAQDGGSCVKLLAEILHLAKDKTSEGEVAQMWQSSGLEWNSFMELSEVDNFLKDKKLEFTVCPLSTGSPSKAVEPGQIDVERITNDIHKLVNDNKPNGDIISYIEKNVPADRQEKTFIRALMTAIASCCNSSTKKAEELVKSRKDVLQRYIKNNPELELQALYAIQALMHKLEHPSGVIAGFFGTLYDEDVISEEALKQWEKSSDPQELEGKGACTLQLTQFFAWLTENEDPEAPS